MKKIFTCLLTFILIIMFTTIASAEDFSMWKIGYGIPGGQLQFTPSNPSGNNLNSNLEMAYSVGYEFISELNENLELGVGAHYQTSIFNDKNQSEPSQMVSFTDIPIYLLLNYYPQTTNKMHYLTGRLGYNILFNCNTAIYLQNTEKPALENIFCAAGVGLKLKRNYRTIRFEALYTISLGYGGYKDNYQQTESPYLPPSYDFDAQIFKSSVVLYLGFEF